MKKDDCPPAEQLSAYAMGTLPPNEAPTIAEHLETCRACDARMADLERKSDELISSLRSPLPDAVELDRECESAVERAQAIVQKPSTSVEPQPDFSAATSQFRAPELPADEKKDDLAPFLQNLIQSRLMSADDIRAFQESLPPDRKSNDAASFTRALVRAGKLTNYQAQMINQGNVKGLVFGEYRVLDKLGEGGMGVVLKAEHRRMERTVAVKMISASAMRAPDAVKRFYREVKAAAKLNHPNIVTAYDASEQDGVHYLVMEFVEGRDLGAIANDKGPLSVGQAVECVVQAARGLQYAHEKGIVHRDIKPANLLLDKSGTLKILDMGLARITGVVDPDDRERLTASGQVMGTCDYMAPEQAVDTHQADPRADIYSLGCTLYRLLTGNVLYRHATLVQILLAHRDAPIPSLCRTRRDIPRALDAVFQKMVAKEPKDRYQSMNEVIAALESCMGGRSSTVRGLACSPDAQAVHSDSPFLNKTGPAPAHEEKAASRKKKTLLISIAAGLAGIVAIVALAVIIRIQHPDGQETVITTSDGSKVTVTKTDNAVPESPSTKTSPLKDAIDLMPLIDPMKDAVQGEWKIGNDGLMGDKNQFARIEIPYKPAAEYDFRVEFTPQNIGLGGCQHLAKGKSNFTWNFFAQVDHKLFGFERVKGKSIQTNPTKTELSPLERGRRYVSLVEVRNDGVRGYLDGNLVVAWKTDYSDLDAFDGWKLRDPSLLGVGCQTRMIFHRIEVREVTGKGKFTRSDGKTNPVGNSSAREAASVAAKPNASPFLGPDGNWKLPVGAPPPAIAPFDEPKAKEHQKAWASYLGLPAELTNEVGMKLALIPPGEFDMGSTQDEVDWALETSKTFKEHQSFIERIPSEIPRHRVRVSRPYFFGLYQVTQGEYEKVIGMNPSAFANKQADASAFRPPLNPSVQEGRADDAKKVAGTDTTRHPVETVSWEDAADFCRLLSAMPKEQAAGRRYRLPTEAECEYACRAGTTTRWYSGNSEYALADIAWFSKNAGGRTHPVGEKKPNAWGLHDMCGNVRHWCADWFSMDTYARSPSSDPVGPSSGDCRVIRGGSWTLANPAVLRPACRNAEAANTRQRLIGFRVVCEVVFQPKSAAESADDTFTREVAALPAEQQVARVVAKLKELNPGYDGNEKHKIVDGQVADLYLTSSAIRDISPVRALVNLNDFSCLGRTGQDGNNPISDLTPLNGLSLTKFGCNCSNVDNLIPLQGMPLVQLGCWETKVANLSPLQGMPIKILLVNGTLVTDISPLRGMPLTRFYCHQTKVTDLSPLKETPLRELRCDFVPNRDTEILRSIKTLETINGLPVAEFWKQLEAGNVPSAVTGQGRPYSDDAFIKEVAALPAEQQVARVVAKLKELNPGYDGKETHRIDGRAVTEFNMSGEHIKNIAPLAAMRQLKKLRIVPKPGAASPLSDISHLAGLQLSSFACECAEIRDLSPLRGQPLEEVAVAACHELVDITALKGMKLRHLNLSNNVQPMDFSMLQGMPLEEFFCIQTEMPDLSLLSAAPLSVLRCFSTPITSLSPLRGKPLKRLDFEPKLASDPSQLEVVRSLKTLETINGKSAAEFWKAVEAGKLPVIGPGGEIPLPNASMKAPRRTDDAFLKEVAALPAEQQVARVVAKLKELNPGYDGNQTHRIENGTVTEFAIQTENINDISPLAALRQLTKLRIAPRHAGYSPLADLTALAGLKLMSFTCDWTQIRDLSPLCGQPLEEVSVMACYKLTDVTALKGMKLRRLIVNNNHNPLDFSILQGMPLEHFECVQTKMSDLSLLSDAPLTSLRCWMTPITDLSPLRGKPLRDLEIDTKLASDSKQLDILRSVKTLEKINDKPAAEFWNEVKADKVPSPRPAANKP